MVIERQEKHQRKLHQNVCAKKHLHRADCEGVVKDQTDCKAEADSGGGGLA